MDVLEAIKNVCGSTDGDIAKAVDELDKELAGIQLDIVQDCTEGDFERAWECLAQYDRVMKLKEFVCSLKNTEEVKED